MAGLACPAVVERSGPVVLWSVFYAALRGVPHVVLGTQPAHADRLFFAARRAALLVGRLSPLRPPLP